MLLSLHVSSLSAGFVGLITPVFQVRLPEDCKPSFKAVAAFHRLHSTTLPRVLFPLPLSFTLSSSQSTCCTGSSPHYKALHVSVWQLVIIIGWKKRALCAVVPSQGFASRLSPAEDSFRPVTICSTIAVSCSGRRYLLPRLPTSVLPVESPFLRSECIGRESWSKL